MTRPFDEREYRREVARAAGDAAADEQLDGRDSAGTGVGNASVAAWPDPPDRAAYHGLAGEIVGVIAPRSEADPIAILGQLLVAVGNAIDRGPSYTVEADRHGVNLFVLLVGASAKGRKGSAWGHVRRVLAGTDPEWTQHNISHGLSSGEGLIWAVRDPIVKTQPVKEKGKVVRYEEVQDDPGIADKRLLVVESEFASTLRVMGRDGSTLSATVRQAWDTGSLRTMVKNSPAQATDAHISIIGHTTADELRRYLDKTEAGNGFANRFLILCVRRAQCLPEGAVLDDELLTPLAYALKNAIAFARTTGEITRTPAARERWAAVYPELSAGRPGVLGAVTSRAEAQVLRLSMLYALLDQSREIGVKHLDAALALWAYAEASARFVFGESLGDPVGDTILAAILKAGAEGLTRTAIRDLLGRHKARARIERTLADMVALGLIERVREETGGRPVERYRTATKATKATKTGVLSHMSLLSHPDTSDDEPGPGDQGPSSAGRGLDDDVPLPPQEES